MKNVDMPVLANLDTPRRVHLEKRPAAHPQGLFFATQKIYFDGVEKNPRSAPGKRDTVSTPCLVLYLFYLLIQVKF